MSTDRAGGQSVAEQRWGISRRELRRRQPEGRSLSALFRAVR